MTDRTFAIGDIHGCATALETVCESLSLAPQDRLIILGDIVDRGPETAQAIQYLLDLKHRCELIVIMGNHEEMMLHAFESQQMFRNWMMVGGKEALDSYGGDPQNITDIHRAFLAEARDFYETATEIFVHANLEPGISLSQQLPYWLRWQHLTGWETPHDSGKRIICGHTQQRSGLPLVVNGWVCLDTATYRGNPLTCLQLESDLCHRATQDGVLLEPKPLSLLASAKK